MSDAYFREPAERTGMGFVPFDPGAGYQRFVDCRRRAGPRRRSSQAELEAFAAAKVRRAMRLAVSAAVRADPAVPAVAKAPS